jgi:hypothetical protein
MQLAERLRGRELRVPWQPWSVLAPLVLVQWLGTAVYAYRAARLGWYLHNDPRATWTWTGGWLLGHGHLSGADAGWGWSYLLMPLTWITGGDYAAALPVLIVVQGLVLLPLGLALAYAAGSRLGGRAIGYFAAVLWALGPFLVVAQIESFGHHPVEDNLVSVALGLTGSSALPGALALLASAWLVLGALDRERIVGAEAAGIAAGLAIAIDPLNGLYLAAPCLAFLLARHWRGLAGFAAGLAPFLVAVAVWRARSPQGLDLEGIRHALHFSAPRLSYTFTWVREYFWSLRMFQWIAAAGFLALLRVSPAKAVFAGSWLLMFVLFRGSDQTVDSISGGFWTAVLPGLPAFCLLCAALPLLVPLWGPRLQTAFAAGVPWRLPLRTLGALVVLLAVVPLVWILASSGPGSRAAFAGDGTYVPADRALGLAASKRGARVTLSWRPSGHGREISYTVYRDGAPTTKTTYSTTFADTPPPGRHTYQVAWVAANAVDGTGGITLELSRPVAVTVR